jgi:hypothetical protein
VIKKPDRPAVSDPKANTRVRLNLKVVCASATKWRSGKTHPKPVDVQLNLGPGAIEYVEFEEGTRNLD